MKQSAQPAGRVSEPDPTPASDRRDLKSGQRIHRHGIGLCETAHIADH
jgi:hypothetical protein